MKKRTRRLMGMLALALGAIGAVVSMKKLRGKTFGRKAVTKADVWARPGMEVTFRAELMPGRDPSERVYKVKELLPSGRVVLQNFAGEHMEKEFEPIR
jgi:hypothetical protein